MTVCMYTIPTVPYGLYTLLAVLCLLYPSISDCILLTM